MGVAVGAAVGLDVGDGVGSVLGAAVGATVGRTVVGGAVGRAVGGAVGFAVGRAVGGGVGRLVGRFVVRVMRKHWTDAIFFTVVGLLVLSYISQWLWSLYSTATQEGSSWHSLWHLGSGRAQCHNNKEYH